MPTPAFDPPSTTSCELLLEACVQASSQVFKFGEQNTFLGGQDFCFYYMFKKYFLSTTKIGGNASEWLLVRVAVQKRFISTGL